MILAFLPMAACEGEQLGGFRTDVGFAEMDGGTLGPLPLSPGDRFMFSARLTARDSAAIEDRSALYTLDITLNSVDDQGDRAESHLTFSAQGENTFNRDWTEVYDFSSWIGRLGPSLTTDQISNQTVEVGLGQIPELPSRAIPKTLPSGNLFVDLRRIETIRDQFAEVHQDHQPRVVDEAMNNGRWRFEYQLTDPTIITYDVQTRAVAMEIDTRGVVVRLEESLGNIDQPPFATTVLELMP